VARRTRDRAPRPRPAKVDGKSFTIGFLNPIAANENLKAIQAAAQAQAQALGMKFIAKDDQQKPDKQVSDFDQLLAQGADAIIVYPLDPKALSPSLKQAKAKGVPIVGFDVTFTRSAPTPDGYVAQIWQGRDTQAFVQAQALAQAKPGASVGLIGTSLPIPGLQYVTSREKYWAGEFGLKVLGEQGNPTDDVTGGQQAASSLLSKYPDMSAVLGYNDPSALGAAAAAATQGRSVITVGGNGGSDGLAGIKSGKLTATFQNDAVGQGQQAVYAAYDSLTDQHLPLPKIIVRGPVDGAVSKANVGAVQTWDQQVAAIK
jgi:ribose transport system substrate-binding protein